MRLITYPINQAQHRELPQGRGTWQHLPRGLALVTTARALPEAPPWPLGKGLGQTYLHLSPESKMSLHPNVKCAEQQRNCGSV